MKHNITGPKLRSCLGEERHESNPEVRRDLERAVQRLPELPAELENQSYGSNEEAY